MYVCIYMVFNDMQLTSKQHYIWICLKVYLDLSEYREPQKSDSLSFSLVEQP